MIPAILIFIVAVGALLVVMTAFFNAAKRTVGQVSSPARTTVLGGKYAFTPSGGVPMADCDYREDDISAVDTWTAIASREGSASGGMDVGGQGRKKLTSITISVAPILTKGTGVLTGAIAIRLSGTGMARGGNYKFLGPSATVQVDTSENAACCPVPSVTYHTDIDMKDGKMDIEALMTGDDLGTVTVNVTCSFADTGTPGGIVDCDVREGNATAVNTLTGMTTLGSDTPGNFNVPISDANKLALVGVMQTPDPPTTLAEVQFSATFKLSGTGFNEGGTRRFGADGLAFGGDTAGSCMESHGPTFYPTDIPVKEGEIEAQFAMLGTDPGGTMGMMVLGYTRV